MVMVTSPPSVIGYLIFFLFQHMIENYSNLMYQNMANQRQQGAPPPPGKGSREKLKNPKNYPICFQKTDEGLEIQGAQIKVALDPPGVSSTPQHL